MPGKFERYKDKKGEIRFRLKASNGQIILASEGYKSRTSCMNGIALVQKNGPKADRYQATNGKRHFVLKVAFVIEFWPAASLASEYPVQ